MVVLWVVLAILVVALGLVATLMVWYGLFGWIGNGVQRCKECHCWYLTPYGHARRCSLHPEHLHHHHLTPAGLRHAVHPHSW